MLGGHMVLSFARQGRLEMLACTGRLSSSLKLSWGKTHSIARHQLFATDLLYVFSHSVLTMTLWSKNQNPNLTSWKLDIWELIFLPFVPIANEHPSWDSVQRPGGDKNHLPRLQVCERLASHSCRTKVSGPAEDRWDLSSTDWGLVKSHSNLCISRETGEGAPATGFVLQMEHLSHYINSVFPTKQIFLFSISAYFKCIPTRDDLTISVSFWYLFWGTFYLVFVWQCWIIKILQSIFLAH